MSAHREPFLAACVQMRAGADKRANLALAEALVGEAARRGARLVALPENFSWRGRGEDDAAAWEPLDGPTVGLLATLARRHRATIVGGSFLEEPRAAGELPGNTSVVLGEDGSLLATYRKIHLFDVSIPGRVESRESERRAAGTEVVCVDAEVARLGLSVCYDLRFPELYRALGRAGAQVFCIPSAFTFPTGAAHWEVLLRARAIENQCYVLAPNQWGPTPHGHLDYGHSAIVDPWGTVLACAPEGDGVILAEVDLARLARVRAELPCLEHVRLGAQRA